MDVRTFLRALRKNWWMVVVAVVLGAGGAVGVIVRTAPTYASSVTFFVNTSASTETNPLQSAQYALQRVTSYVELVSSERLAKLVIDDADLDMSVRAFKKAVSAESDLNTVLLTATVTDNSAERSLKIAESISTEFVAMVGTIDPTVRLEVTSGPTLNPDPVAPAKKLDLGLGILIGLVIGMAAAAGRELMDNTVRSLEDLRELTSAPVLGHIGRDSAVKKTPLIVESQARSIRAEAFRQMRTNLQFVDVDRPAKVFVVTSSVAGEGKSITAANLALTFAEAGSSVLLVEGDLRRPGISDLLGVERAIGLTNVLAGQVHTEDVLQQWGRGNLTVLPSGSIPPNPSELLGSQNMVELLESLRTAFEIVVIDTPPLLPVTDAAVVAAHADGAVVVVRYGKTKRHQVSTAMHSLRSIDARILGCVLNMAPMKDRESYLVYDGYAMEETTDLGESSSPVPRGRLKRARHDADNDADGGSERPTRGSEPG